ncbi:unnamed protein product, partial [Discosporangium mesarthrocarpum]
MRRRHNVLAAVSALNILVVVCGLQLRGCRQRGSPWTPASTGRLVKSVGRNAHEPGHEATYGAETAWRRTRRRRRRPSMLSMSSEDISGHPLQPHRTGPLRQVTSKKEVPTRDGLPPQPKQMLGRISAGDSSLVRGRGRG